jgi:hypothetical protein
MYIEIFSLCIEKSQNLVHCLQELYASSAIYVIDIMKTRRKLCDTASHSQEDDSNTGVKVKGRRSTT